MSKFIKIAIAVLVVVGVTFTVSKTRQGSHPTTEQLSDTGKAADATSGAANTKDAAGADGSQAGPGANGVAVGPDSKPVGGATGAGGVAGTQGTTGAPGTHMVNGVLVGPDGKPVAGSEHAAAPSKPDSNCFSFEYKHQKEALNKDIEDFLDYSNAFPILHAKVTEKSICVKVNGKPVPFKLSKYKSQEEVVIGSVVGPESLIKVSYCVGTSACKEACAVKSNRFMDDLMSDAGDEDEFKESWGDAKEQKKELQAKVKEFRSVASANKDLQKQSTIRVWDTVQKNEWFCKK